MPDHLKKLLTSYFLFKLLSSLPLSKSRVQVRLNKHVHGIHLSLLLLTNGLLVPQAKGGHIELTRYQSPIKHLVKVLQLTVWIHYATECSQQAATGLCHSGSRRKRANLWIYPFFEKRIFAIKREGLVTRRPSSWLPFIQIYRVDLYYFLTIKLEPGFPRMLS